MSPSAVIGCLWVSSSYQWDVWDPSGSVC